MTKVKVRRTHREELPGMVVLRDAVIGRGRQVLDLDMEIDPDLSHIIRHDPDGFMTAVDHEETLGYGAAFVRSRQWILSQLWVLPQHQGRGAGEALLSKLLAFGENSGAREFLAVVPPASQVQGLLISHGFSAVMPVYQIRLNTSEAPHTASSLAKMLPGRDASRDLLGRQGQSDIDHIDRIARNLVREADHLYWLKERSCRAAVVRQGNRIAAYGYGGPHQIGPVAGTTRDAAMSALGHAIQFALDADTEGGIDVSIPAAFSQAIEAMLENRARICSTSLLYGRNLTSAFDRVVFGTPTLP